MDAFDRLHPDVQRQLFDMGWKELRPVQARAIHHLLDRRGDCIISVPTAGGKTEAAFLPILSDLADHPEGGIRAMYIGPLKALINDQFRRVDELCGRMAMEVHRWHGDVGQHVRRRVVADPRGVLLITPESLEAMFVLRATRMPSIFARLEYVVIDELHAFIGTERGTQLRSQLERLRRRCGCDPVRVGLSATIADKEGACRWLRPAGPPATLLDDPTAERGIAVKLRGFWREPVRDDDKRTRSSEEDPRIVALQEAARAMLVAVRGKTTLAFANSKATIETLADALQVETKRLALPDHIVVHHGSLSKELREDAEAYLQSGRPCVAVCSNTLELGIDVGDVDGVVQFAAPPSVAALVQRVGRSGRRTDSSKLRGFFIAERPDTTTSVWDALQPDFLRGLASCELMLQGFLEPIAYERAHSSTLVQQLLSLLAEHGGMPAVAAHTALFEAGAFPMMTPAAFAGLLRSLAGHGLIEQMPQGDLILAPAGMKLVEHYDFYAAFRSSEEVVVCHGGDRIGALPAEFVPPVGEHLLLGGRRWRVTRYEMSERIVLVEPSAGRRAPVFSSARRDSDATLHRKMREIALGTDVPVYLDETAREILASLRLTAAGLGGFEPMRQSAGQSVRLFLWGGSRLTRTLLLCLHARWEDAAVGDHDFGLEVEANEAECDAALSRVLEAPPAGDELASLAEELFGARSMGEKYDAVLPPRAWAESYAREQLDVSAALTATALLRAASSTPASR